MEMLTSVSPNRVTLSIIWELVTVSTSGAAERERGGRGGGREGGREGGRVNICPILHRTMSHRQGYSA